jgi:3-phosphoshikimate 1-carboxyvinyltransferase
LPTNPAQPERPKAIAPRSELDATIRVPGSKSLTNRALLIAGLAEGASQLHGALSSDDTVVMRQALVALGAQIEDDPDPWVVIGTGGRFAAPTEPLYTRNSGTTARFLAAAASLAAGPVVIDGNARMRERPIVHLVDGLRSLGVEVEMLGRDGCPPIRVAGGGLPGGPGEIDASESSQYVSALLLAAPYAEKDVELTLTGGLVTSRPYIDVTLEAMRAFGARADWVNDTTLHVEAGAAYSGRDYPIEADASSAAYPFCSAAVTGGRITVEGVRAESLQSDFEILGLLERMGCEVTRAGETVTVQGPAGGRLRSLGTVDMNAFPDAVLAYAVVCLFADGPTTITDVYNLRIKETDRLAALETELRKLGAGAETGRDWLTIEPPTAPATLHGAEIETYDDHRMAMAFSVAGLRVPGVVILDPGCVSKTWPGYFDAFEAM